jgi:hypothetical protein
MPELLINMAFSILFAVIKNSAHVALFKKALHKLRDILNTLPLDGTV